MSAPAPPRPVPPAPATTPGAPPEPGLSLPALLAGLPWVTAIASGVAVLLAGAAVSAIVSSPVWLIDAVVAVVVVVAVGLALHRFGPAWSAVGQCVALLMLVTVRFAHEGILGVLPGPAAFKEFGGLVTAAGQQISVGIAPVAATPEILFLVTGAFGLLTIGVYLAAVSANAPAAAGVPLLAIFAVPAALTDDLLPWWTLVSAAAGFGLLLVMREGARRQLVGGAAVVAGAVVVALVAGAGAGFVGTSGRFGGAAQTSSAGTIGVVPFTALRGQLLQSTPVELFKVYGLEKPAYLRALTLPDFIPDVGWRANTNLNTNQALPGPTGNPNVSGPGPASVRIENVAFKDYWLPLYGLPLEVNGVTSGVWAFDPRAGIGFTRHTRQEDSWTMKSLMPAPGADELRADNGPESPGPDFLNATGLDPRVSDIAKKAVAGATTTFDKAYALQNFFRGPGSGFTYSLATKPGGTDDALVNFLTVGRTGYCEQFASAMAVMLRSVGVPARVAVGFTPGQVDGDHRSITTSDAHAWVEVWFPQHGWLPFDPTPLTDGRTVDPPYIQQAQAQLPGGESPADDPKTPRGATPDATTPTPEPVAAPGDMPAAPPPASGGGVPLWPLAVLVVFAVAALAPFGLRSRERRRRLAAAAAGGPTAAGAAWDEILAESADRGSPGRPSDTVRGAARRLVREHQLDPTGQQALRQVVGAVEASWYGGGHPEPGALDEHVRAVREAIAAGTSLTVRERFLPRSVLRGLTGKLRRHSTEPEDDDQPSS